MNKRPFLLAIILLTVISNAIADQLSPSEALQRLSATNVSLTQGARRAFTSGKLKLAYTSRSASLNSFYAFNDTEGGYVILSADDCLPAVLATSENGTFDYASLPENMKWFLSLYDRAVKNYSRKKVRLNTLEADPIKPMLENSWLGSIEWSQSQPFNNQMPRYKNETTATGCVTTALSQILAYHKWPVHGYGEATDTFHIRLKKDSVDKPLNKITLDLSKTTYDWNNLLPKYINQDETTQQNYNETQANAVSTLMYHAAVASHIQFGISAAGGSSGNTDDVGKALTRNFGYSKAIEMLFHYAFTNEEWDKIVYDELRNGRPVYFSGSNPYTRDGHAFVCDGFKDGLFHINWGWDGDSNKYFYVTGTGLNADYWEFPDSTGNIFGYNLEALIGIQPDPKADQGGSTKYSMPKMSTAEFLAFLDGDTLTMRGYFHNTYYDSLTFIPGIALISKDTLYYAAKENYSKLDNAQFYENSKKQNTYYVKLPKTIPADTYIVKPCYTEDGEYFWLTNCYPEIGTTQLVVKANGTFQLYRPEYYSIDAKATASIKGGRTEYYCAPTSKKQVNDSITILLSSELKNINPDYNINSGLMFRNQLTGIESFSFKSLNNYIYPNYVLDEISVEIPSDLNPDTTYTVYPIIWPCIFPDVYEDRYKWDALNYYDVLIEDSTRVPAIRIIARKPSAVQDILSDDNTESQPVKFFRDGVLYIRRDDRLYNSKGQRISL